MNYLIVLFKNKERKKIINKFMTFDNAKAFYDKKMLISNNVDFQVAVENATPCKYEIALLEKKHNNFDTLYVKDSMGRQIKVDLDDDEYRVVYLNEFNVEEKLYDVNHKKKITFNEFVNSYLSNKTVKMISKLNNKVALQEDNKVSLFSLKDSFESKRFLDSLSNYLISNNRMDVIVISDTSPAQKKYLYEILSGMGLDKKLLYRTTTTFKPRK
jgi:hypothetical protein